MALINEVLDRAPDADHMLDDMIHWPDNPEDAWYYEDVQEATNCHTYRWSGSLERWIQITDMRTYADLSGTPCAAHDNPLIWLEPGSGGSFPAPPGPFPPQKARRCDKFAAAGLLFLF